MSEPLDLRKVFGHCWKFGMVAIARSQWTDPWNYMIECLHGGILPRGDDKLATSLTGAGLVANRRLRLPDVEATRYGGDGVTIIFFCHSPMTRAVTSLVKPWQAWKASPAQLPVLKHGCLNHHTETNRGFPSQRNPILTPGVIR